MIIEPTPENIKSIFDDFYKADITLWTEFSKKLSVQKAIKNQVIKDYDVTEKSMNILINGSVGLFVWDGQDDICINLYYENNFFCDYLSFLKQKPTLVKSQALENCLFWSIKYQDLQELYAKSVIGVHIGKIIAEELFIRKQTEQVQLLTLTPKERYLRLIEERPMTLQRTPLKIVASYLGLTAESLSRIRKRI